MADPVQSASQQPQEDQTASLVIKFLAAYIAAPKTAAFLSHLGIGNIDPVIAGTALMGALHKAHVFLKNETGWKWL